LTVKNTYWSEICGKGYIFSSENLDPMANVLIVDDDEELLELVCLMVRTSNLNAICIGSGAEVFPNLESTPIDLVLMDVYLGSHDGRELAKQIKTDLRFNHIPILLYSAGSITPESIQESLANDFIRKPFDMPLLIDRIKGFVAA
jgi:CheY-like chemotaxis protein